MLGNYIPPDISSWKFASELSESTVPVFQKKPGTGQFVHIRKDFPDEDGILNTAYESLIRYFNSADYPFATYRKEAVWRVKTVCKLWFAPEEYRISIRNHAIEIAAKDSEGIRRGIYALEDILCGNNGKIPETLRISRKPWLKTRLGRSPFSPVKRWPVYTDELLDKYDYYPDALLERLAHDAVNGIWVVAALRELSLNIFSETDPQRDQRLAKLNQLTRKCRRYGIRVFLFMIEPFGVLSDDELLRKHPEMFGPSAWGGKNCFCPAAANTKKYLFDSFRSIFNTIPDLGGVINISLGERPTTCLSSIRTTNSEAVRCQSKCGLEPGEIMNLSLQAMEDGMKAGSPSAKFLAWFYLPETEELAPWVSQATARIPKGVIPQFNFESAAVKVQLGKRRKAGDYWVSCIGPSQRFLKTAAKNPGRDLSAKLQLSCGHEFTVVPYIPVPSIVYKKYKAMHQAGVNHVMHSWYIGNFPGLLSRAMGLLAFEDFKGTEDAFLRFLAKLEWYEDWRIIVRAWKKFSTGYQHFPFSLLFQYYAPQNSFVNWKFYFMPELFALTPPWKPNYPASGDAIGEALGGFEIEEVLILLSRINSCWRQGCALLAPLREKYRSDRDRLRDLQLAEAIEIIFAGTKNLFHFYLLRRKLFAGDKRCLKEMTSLIANQKELYTRLIPILENDSRIGFHGEALTRIFDKERTRQAIISADASLKEAEILQNTHLSPLHYAVSTGILQVIPPKIWREMPGCRWQYAAGHGNLTIFIKPAGSTIKGIECYFIDLCGTRYPLYEMFDVSKNKITGQGNLHKSVTGKCHHTGVQARIHNGVFQLIWPISRLPINNGEYMIRFDFMLITDTGIELANGNPYSGRLLMGAVSPHDTVCLQTGCHCH